MLVMYPIEFEISLDKADDTVFAKFKAFDDESFEVKLETICCSDDLRDLADKLDDALKMLKDGLC